MILSTLGSSLIVNLLSRRGLFREGKGLYRAGSGNKCSCEKKKRNYWEEGQGIFKKSLILPKSYPLTNFEIEDYYKNKRIFNSVSSRDNLPHKIKNEAYLVNLDEYH